MTAPSPLPRYIYKILPSAAVDPFYAFPIPLPASHEFALSPLDSKDGFLHFSTRNQLEQTLSRFFKEEKSVVLLKCELARLSGFKVVKWEAAGSGGASHRTLSIGPRTDVVPTVFPHLYASLLGEDVESFKELFNTSGDWEKTLLKAKDEGWLLD